MRHAYIYSALIALGFAAPPLQAKQVTFSGTVETTCTMLVVNGELGINSSYSVLGSEEPGGSPARLNVVTVGGSGQITLSKPQWGARVPQIALEPEIRFTSNRGLSQDYTDSATDPVVINFTDAFDIHARARTAAYFDAGDYEITTVATCET